MSSQEMTVESLPIRREARSLFETIRRLEKGYYKIKSYEALSLADSSRLVLFCLKRIPLAPFWVTEKGEMFDFLEGSDRLGALWKFRKNEFRLTGGEVTGEAFEDLPEKFQNRFDETQFMFFIAPPKATAYVKDQVLNHDPQFEQQKRHLLSGLNAYLEQAAHMSSAQDLADLGDSIGKLGSQTVQGAISLMR